MPSAEENAKRAAIAASKGLPQISKDVSDFIIRYGDEMRGEMAERAEGEIEAVRAELRRRIDAEIYASGGRPGDLD